MSDQQGIMVFGTLCCFLDVLGVCRVCGRQSAAIAAELCGLVAIGDSVFFRIFG